MGAAGGISRAEYAKRMGRAIIRLIVLIVVYVVIAAIVNNVAIPMVSTYVSSAAKYAPYVNILLGLLFGYFIVYAFADVIYWSLMIRYDHSAAAAVRNVFRMIGIGAMVATIAGGVVGGAAGVALGGFLGIVVGFASQQVLGNAISGLFILISRPFRITDHVNLLGDEGDVEDVTTLFTYVRKDANTIVVVPSSLILGNKLYVRRPVQQAQTAQSSQKPQGS
ncbi:MAG: mechanosensitive ion channel [Nitrososphaeria archaeon]